MDCKECSFNNNGWCKKYKAQKPKAIIKCEEDKADDKKACENEKYITTGKMLELYNIVRQIDAEPKCCTNEFKKVLKEIHKALEIDISILGIALEYEIDKMSLEDLRKRINNW